MSAGARFALRRTGVARRNLIHSAGILALVVLLMASAAGVTYALWTSSATVTSEAKGAPIAVTSDFGGPLGGFAFQNHELTVSGTFTVTNTTATTRTVPMTVNSLVRSNLPTTMAPAFRVAVWLQSASACANATIPGSAQQGTLASVGAFATALAPGASAVHCVRITATDRSVLGVGSGSFSFNPKVTSTLTVDGAQWRATDESTITQTTQAIYPVAELSTTTWFKVTNATTTGAAGTSCVDVEAGSGANRDGTSVISFGCKNSDTDNQRWKLIKDGSYYRLGTKMSGGRFLAVKGTATSTGDGIEIRAAASEQSLWQLQRISTGVYQLVNKKSGYCLTRGTGSPITPMSQTVCAGGTSQQFVFTGDGTAPRSALSVDPSPMVATELDCDGSNEWMAVFRWSPTPMVQTSYALYVDGTKVPNTADGWNTYVQLTGDNVPAETFPEGTATVEVRQLLTDGSEKSLGFGAVVFGSADHRTYGCA